RYVHDILAGHVTTVMSNRANVEEEVTAADLVIGAVLIPGARAPQLLPRTLVAAMKPGAALVDLAIDQGGCAGASRPTTQAGPASGGGPARLCCATSAPGMVPHSALSAPASAPLPPALAVAALVLGGAVGPLPPLDRACNVVGGHVTHPGVAAAL